MDLLGEILIPVSSILVPTGVAIWLARSERNAAAKEREENSQREAQERAEATISADRERRASGVEHALDAMNDLVAAGYTDDIRQAAAIRIAAGRKISKVYTDLGVANEAVADWVAEELGIVALGLEDRDRIFLPVNLEQIVWRSAHFTNALLNWQAGEKDDAWFADDEPVLLTETTRPVAE